MTNSLVTFNFKDNQIRAQTVDNEPYFCLRDVCLALGLKNSKDRDFNKGVETFYLPTKSGNQNITFINEPNLYRLIFRSNKPQAQAFADWVYSEVLPSIRKTGGYGVPTSKTITTADRLAVGGIVKRCSAAAVREEFAKLHQNSSSDLEALISVLLDHIIKERVKAELKDRLNKVTDLLKE